MPLESIYPSMFMGAGPRLQSQYSWVKRLQAPINSDMTAVAKSLDHYPDGYQPWAGGVQLNYEYQQPHRRSPIT